MGRQRGGYSRERSGRGKMFRMLHPKKSQKVKSNPKVHEMERARARQGEVSVTQ